MIKEYNSFISHLKEGLIKTYPTKTAIRVISKFLGINKIQHNIGENEDTQTIFFKMISGHIKSNLILNILREVGLCGYFISNYDFYDKNDTHIDYLIHDDLISDDFIKNIDSKIKNSFYTQITIEAKMNELLEVPDKLYHVTLTSNEAKIKRVGLIPKSKNKRSNHNDRIYFGFDPIVVKNLSYQFKSGDYILLEISTDKSIKLYNDPDFHKNGCYTYENIKPGNIKVIDRFTIP